MGYKMWLNGWDLADAAGRFILPEKSFCVPGSSSDHLWESVHFCLPRTLELPEMPHVPKNLGEKKEDSTAFLSNKYKMYDKLV